MTQTQAILTSLWELGQAHPPSVPHDGDRLYYRYVDLEGESWDDWNLLGVVLYGGIKWTNSLPAYPGFRDHLREQIDRGLRYEVMQSEGKGWIEWGLFHGDGPDGARVEDWAGEVVE